VFDRGHIQVRLKLQPLGLYGQEGKGTR